jgi:hypothetical protein
MSEIIKGFIFCFGIPAIILSIVHLINHQRLKKIKAFRQQQGFNNGYYYEELAKIDIPLKIQEEVLLWLRQQGKIFKNFPIFPEDKLEDIFSIDPEDYEEMLLEIASRCEMKIEVDSGTLDITTVKDMALYLSKFCTDNK